MICTDNKTVSSSSLSVSLFADGGVQTSARNDAQGSSRAAHKYLISPEVFAWMELSIVPEVEQVFVDRDLSGKQLRIIEVVDKRDPEVRARIYEREKEIMAAHPNLQFDFHIVARQGRNLNDVIQAVGKSGFKR